MSEMYWIPAEDDTDLEYALAGADEEPQGVDGDEGTDEEDDDDPPHQGTNEGPVPPGEDSPRPHK